jgi:hypothetical protein
MPQLDTVKSGQSADNDSRPAWQVDSFSLRESAELSRLRADGQPSFTRQVPKVMAFIVALCRWPGSRVDHRRSLQTRSAACGVAAATETEGARASIATSESIMMAVAAAASSQASHARGAGGRAAVAAAAVAAAAAAMAAAVAEEQGTTASARSRRTCMVSCRDGLTQRNETGKGLFLYVAQGLFLYVRIL